LRHNNTNLEQPYQWPSKPNIANQSPQMTKRMERPHKRNRWRQEAVGYSQTSHSLEHNCQVATKHRTPNFELLAHASDLWNNLIADLPGSKLSLLSKQRTPK
jgi:hypothetical protein